MGRKGSDRRASGGVMMLHINVRRAGAGVLAAAAVALVAVATSSASNNAHASAAPIKIGLITSQTGALASNFVDVAGDFRARIAYQNSLGGVNGHKLQAIVLDDGSTAQGNLAAARKLVGSDHVAVVAQENASGGGSAPYLHSQNVPVVGGPYSGPEWGKFPNLFSDWGREDPSAPAYATAGLIFKKLGAKSIGSVGYGVVPSSKAGAQNAIKSAKAAGLKAPYLNTSVQPGSSDFSTQGLGLKNAGVDGLYAPLGIQPAVALLTAATQAGAKITHSDFVSGTYGILGTPAAKTLQGSAFSLYFLPANFNTPLAKKTNQLVHKFGGAKGRPLYDFDLVGWLSANLAIQGLTATKGNTNGPKIIAALSNLKNYNAGGLLPAKIGFKNFVTSTDVGANGCLFAVQLKGTRFVPMQPTPFCGKKL
jgi:branched-chain amino acid transport system substrate-binding protein